VLVVSEVCARDTRAGRVREGLFDFNKKPVIPDNTIYHLSGSFCPIPEDSRSKEPRATHTFGLAKTNGCSPCRGPAIYFSDSLKLNLTGLPSPDPDPG
jgi:hypothetical protein